MKKSTLVSILFSVLVFVSQVSFAVPEASQNIGKENTMPQPFLGGITKLEIRSPVASMTLPNSAFGTANLELINPMAEGDGISFETANGGELGSGEDLNAGSNTSAKFSFAECQSATGATEANLETACRNNERVQIRATFPSGVVVYGDGTIGSLFKFSSKIGAKAGAKIFTIEMKRFVKQKSDVIS